MAILQGDNVGATGAAFQKGHFAENFLLAKDRYDLFVSVLILPENFHCPFFDDVSVPLDRAFTDDPFPLGINFFFSHGSSA